MLVLEPRQSTKLGTWILPGAVIALVITSHRANVPVVSVDP